MVLEKQNLVETNAARENFFFRGKTLVSKETDKLFNKFNKNEGYSLDRIKMTE